jgi:hypothetical protein
MCSKRKESPKECMFLGSPVIVPVRKRECAVKIVCMQQEIITIG